MNKRVDRPPTRASNARTVALDVLERVDGGAFANVVLPTVLRRSGLDARDRAFTTDLVYGTLRLRLQCDYLLSLASTRPLARVDRPVRVGLQLGVYQLLHGIAPHAAVSATVDAIARRSPRAKGFSNAVLRRVQSLGPEWPWPDGDEPAAIAVRLSYPQWIVEQLIEDVGLDNTLASLATMNEPARLTLRPNPRRTTTEALLESLDAAGAKTTMGGLVPDAITVHGAGDPAQLGAVRDGRATPQDQASQAVVALLDIEPGMRVLDVAAAPGGKATAAAERAGDGGHVIANDVHGGRSTLVAAAVRRLGLGEIVHVVQADATSLPLRPGTDFDRVLVDAPCSGLGVLRRRPEARWRISSSDVDDLVQLQQGMLVSAAQFVAPDGVLLYSVCTLTGSETIGIDEWLASSEAFASFAPLPPPPSPWRQWGRGGLLLPHEYGTDGMFVLRLRRKS